MLEEKIDIKNMIYEIRGKQVVLDSDLAKLYQCKNGTKEINQAVKNNIKKFPDRYAFRINEKEYNYLKSKILTSKGGSKAAIQVSINIIDAFVEMRKYISTNLIEQKYINEIVLKDSKRIDILEETFNQFKEENNHLFFEGQICDEYSLMLDIFNKSNEEIIIIDNYVDKTLFDILSKTNKKVNVITNKYNNEDYLKYKSQYSNAELIIDNNFHDRLIIIDKNILYHCGASFKDLGKKCFCISKIDNTYILNNLLSVIRR